MVAFCQGWKTWVKLAKKGGEREMLCSCSQQFTLLFYWTSTNSSIIKVFGIRLYHFSLETMMLYIYIYVLCTIYINILQVYGKHGEADNTNLKYENSSISTLKAEV